MKRLLTVMFALLLTLLLAVPAWGLSVNATSAFLIDASSGRVIYEQDAHEQLSPASTTKILTCLLVLENVDDLSATVTLPADFDNAGESTIYLEPGQTWTYEDLLYALMLRSANDAAQALAIGVAGSEEAFVEMMNARTAELGLTDSHWANPHGLDDEGHYSSAYDLTMIAKAAMQQPFFNELISTTEHELPHADVDDRVIYNHNKFLDQYEGADGVKTGYTDIAGSCLVASATHGGLRLVGAVMNAEDMYNDMAGMMDYGFSSFDAVEVGKKGDVVGSVRVSGGRVNTVDVVLGSDISVPIEAGSSYSPQAVYDFPSTLEAPFAADQPIGTVTYQDELGNYVKTDLYPAEGLERYTFGTVFRGLWQHYIGHIL